MQNYIEGIFISNIIEIVIKIIYIVIQRQTLSLYHNFLVWLDMYDAWSKDRNPPNFKLDLVSDRSANTLCVPIVVEGDPKASFSILITPRCWGGRYSFPWIAPLNLDSYLIMLSGFSKDAPNNIFWVSGMMLPGIEHKLAKTLTLTGKKPTGDNTICRLYQGLWFHSQREEGTNPTSIRPTKRNRSSNNDYL